MIRRLLFVFFCLLLPVFSAQATSLIQPGFRTLGIWEPATKVRLDLAIWYPANRISTRLDYGDWTFRAARGATPLPGQHPLIVLSHDSAGSRFSLHQLATALTRNGFVVAAPTHPGDNIDNMSSLFTKEQIFARARHLRATLDILLSDPETAPLIDPQRIGVLGVGPGGTAALLLAGARLDATGWKHYCEQPEVQQLIGMPREDPYCSSWAVQRMEALSASSGLGAAYRDRRVRVVATVAPAYAMYLTPKALSRIRIPLLFVKAEKNRMAGPPFQAEALAKALPGSPTVETLPEADTAALMSACSENLAQTLPEMCFAASVDTRNTVQRLLALYASSFFLTHLGSPNPPPVPPDPPEPEEKLVPTPKPTAPVLKKKRRKD